MDVTRAPNVNTGMPQNQDSNEVGGFAERERDQQNAVNRFQAIYGAKPKETRPVKKALDKDDFMRIMITEMKHQDPTKPMDADRMATQMAQITSVEQLKNVSNSLDKLADKSSTSDRLAMSMMIGKTVTVDKGRFSHQKNNISSISFDLPEDSEKIKLTILDDRGEEVAVKELEPMKAGPNTYNWDGINASNIQAPSANYTIRVEAEGKEGKKLKVNSIARETVVGVGFEGGETNFLVGDPKNPQKVNLKNVIRLEGDAQLKSVAQQNKATDAQMAKAKADSGETTSNNEAFALPENVRKKLGLDTPEAQAALTAANSDRTTEKAEGFPNGLQE